MDNEQATQRLRDMRMRPTRQRVALACLLFRSHHRHITAESLHEEAARSGINISLATVYNTLHNFTNEGYLRRISLPGNRAFFDTDVKNHHHFFLDSENQIFDITNVEINVSNLPEPPAGMEISHIDVIVCIRHRSPGKDFTAV